MKFLLPHTTHFLVCYGASLLILSSHQRLCWFVSLCLPLWFKSNNLLNHGESKDSKLRNKFFTEAAAITVTNSPFNPKNASNLVQTNKNKHMGISYSLQSLWTYGYCYSLQSLHQLWLMCLLRICTLSILTVETGSSVLIDEYFLGIV